MYKPNEPISNLKGVGEQIENKLKRENIKHIGDLINYFPFRHEDLSQIKTIAEIKQVQAPLLEKNSDTKTPEKQEKVVLKGQFKQITTFITRTRKFITKAKFYDDSGIMDIMWFNSPYIKQQLNETKIFLVTAKPSFYKNKLNIVNPTVEVSMETKESTHIGRIVPVYFNINGIALRTLRKLIKEAVENTEITDFLNENQNDEIASGAQHLRNDMNRVGVNARNEVTKQSDFLNLKEAYLNLHFPVSFEMIEKAKDRIALNELIHVKLHSKKLREITEKKKSNFSINKSFLHQFYPVLPFELTTDQKGAIEAIEKLMSKKTPSNILVSGDVGSGKTLVAIASSYNTIKNGGKVIYLAPTVVLAEQVYSEFCKYLQNSGLKIKSEKLKVEIQLVTSKTSKLFRHSDPELAEGEESQIQSDILIGTHALLNIPNIEKFANLVIIDEQHKFGVKQRAKLIESNNAKLPHVVTMTATPIPRSLALTYFDELDLLPIKTKPAGRIPITTKVLDESKKLDCLKWIKTEVIKKTKTYYIVPFIEKSESILFENIKNITDTEKELKKYFGEKNVWVLHGKLKDNEKTEVISDFKSKKGGILLSTQVVEVGVDIKDATVIVIESAERFGLASLHQLRGRVGRSNLKSYCFLVPSTKSALESTRLKNLEKENDGFKLAEMDLKTRGSGEIFGIRQSGELDLKFVNFGNETLIKEASDIANTLYEDREAMQKYKDNFFTRDFFEIKDN